MCIVFVALEQHPGYKFVILSNRDEALSRPTLRSHFWDPTSAPAAIDSVEVSDITENTDYSAIERSNVTSEAATNQILAGTEFALICLLNSNFLTRLCSLQSLTDVLHPILS